ncbi:Flp pilus assembly protein TadD, contains TPR repeats [Fontimonas thermophila]|uniref:Flp pilus assembly protein TadD, contains TPR repeats n=1 Tax=Fontimonas thermophila TaxID=1076937 RepID=A0A1I2H7B9_9GAMM|nr:tetratricopeptide repeat protein [Fontimonas thermophila]SFF24531.1 Flp pilus assembly protein TadD, contains TPR repeats [Fontimonas thermophila]
MSVFCRIAAIAAALILSPVAFASSVSAQAQTLIEQGRADEALRLLDEHLKNNPQDAEARFAKGLALVRLERNKDAIRVFADLTRDYPQLPEPYNNLAVLYAAQGDYEKARDALEAALATHPSYATAHENLGDIYAALAGAAYNRALMLDESNQVVRRKLALINQLDASAPAEPPPAATATAASTSTPAAPAAAPVASAGPVPQVAEPAEPTLDADTRAALQRALDAWAQAWSQQDLDAYFAAYSEQFVPEGGLSRSTWQAQRRERISQPKQIRVTVTDPQFKATGPGRASVVFRQSYASDTFSDTVTKTLDFERTADGWKIVREYTR